MAAECRRWRPSFADGGRAPQMAVKRRRCRASPMVAKPELRRWRPSSVPSIWPSMANLKPSDADGGQHSRAGQCEIKSNLIKLLQEKCGEEIDESRDSRLQ